jgi:hypothetical protein
MSYSYSVLPAQRTLYDTAGNINQALPRGSAQQSTGFFNRAQANSNDVADVTARVGPGFDPKLSCNRNAVVDYDQPGSSVWVAVDKTPPVLTTLSVSVDVDQADPTALIATRGRG